MTKPAGRVSISSRSAAPDAPSGKRMEIAAAAIGCGLAVVLAGAGCSKPRECLNRPAAGADCPWIRHEAEGGTGNAATVGPSRQYLTPESEASGRSFVRLDAEGQHVEFKAGQAANTIVVRHCIPDAPEGGGTESTLGLYVNGSFVRKLHLSSRFAWIYGDFPWSNDPKQGKAHHFFDETHAVIPDLSPGDVVRLQKDADDTAAFYLIDFIELEQIAGPLPQPPGSLSLTEFGALPNDGKDASAAMVNCIAAARAQGKPVWIPVGEFRLDGPRIKVGGVRIHGAGIWYSKLTGETAMFEGTGEAMEFSDLAIFGEVDRRVDELPENAFDGNFGKGSVFRNLWIEHLKCGFWTRHGTSHMRVENCRIRNVMADGLNFCDGTSDSVVEQCHLRNTGDDALATWSPSGDWSSKTLCRRNRFLHNTIESPWLANCIAIYGGADHEVSGNLLSGTVFSGGGVLVSSGFDALPFAGAIRIDNNTIRDAGGDCYIGEPVGALWVHAKQSDIDAEIRISGLTIDGGPESGITLHGPKAVNRLVLRDVRISGVAKHGIDVRPDVSGGLNASGVQIKDIGLDPIHGVSTGRFVAVIEEITGSN